MAGVPCAIELEPKTLNPLQINHARELAVVIQKIDPQEAPNLFIQGLQQVKSSEDLGQINEGQDGNFVGNNMVDESNTEMDNNTPTNIIKEQRPHNCLCANFLIDSPDDIVHKEPVTAPF
ncbi:hypothetical protein RND81_11G119600 [Saponaria officinalis]|uniref:Uncharacterized protein n=1 Tax=Saponaria officinalis TaxID=3572 RepID=A0AAW1HL02_SAPOF